ncbi:dual specificity protein phosphatase 14-like [Crotalus adamanteus]|uniref:Dual specificity protein phosphatase 14-like n=2 Tax=Crotalus TaxID=8728 RepID=A0AAW1B629_CROAD
MGRKPRREGKIRGLFSVPPARSPPPPPRALACVTGADDSSLLRSPSPWQPFVASNARMVQPRREAIGAVYRQGSALTVVMYAEPSNMNFRNHGFFRRSPPTSVAKPSPAAGNTLSVLGGIAQISPCLYLCSGNAASNRHMVYSRAVSCIVNATMEIPNANWPDIDYVKVPVPDLPHAPLSLYFDSVADRIHQTGKKNGRTLVHCVAGVSRSASLCIAYLMKYHRLSLLDAHEWVKSRRPVVRPNVGFWRQLIEYERKLFGKNTVKMVPSPIGLIPDVYEKETRGLVPLWNLR